jgi:hypothetical protein
MNYILSLVFIVLSFFNLGLTQTYNCSSCYYELKTKNILNLCEKALGHGCDMISLENNNSGLKLCKYFMAIPCTYIKEEL